MEERAVQEDAPVDFPFRPGRDVLPGKGEWFKRNNVFFRDKVGEYSDMYDTCSKVSDKRDIARLVVEAVYENGGRFLDAEGNDIGFKRSMDKAMKALKDRRHIKGRKLVGKPTSQSGEAIKKRTEATKKSPKDHKPPMRDPLSTDDAGHALLLLRNASDEFSSEGSPSKERSRLPINKRHHPTLGGRNQPHSSLARRDPHESERLDYRRYEEELTEEGEYDDSRLCLSRQIESSYARRKNSAEPRLAKAPVSAKVSVEEKERESIENPKEGQGGLPVLWQSVIVSRENPQATLADMLVNAKQRLDALSSIQKAVSAPICLIYPPNPNFSLPSQVAQVPQSGQVTAGLISLGGQVQLSQIPLSHEYFQSAGAL